MSTHLKQYQRGSIEVIVLVLVFAIAIGLIVWRVAETYNAQSDAEHSAAMAENAPEVPAKYIEVPELGFSFLNPPSAGEITYTLSGEKTIRLTSNKLRQATYTCEGESTGEFGALTVAHKDDPKPVPAPAFTKTIGDKEYRFASGFQQVCYEKALMKQFTEDVPQAIMNSIGKRPLP